MGNITFVIPYEEIAPIAERTFREMNDDEWQMEIVLAPGVQCVMKRDFVTDAIIARGVTVAALKRMPISAPVIDLPVSGYDIMRSIKTCQENFGVHTIGIVGSHDMVYGAKSMEEIMDVQLEVVEVNDEEDAEPNIRRLMKKDIGAIIGGVMSTLIARKFGLNAVYIQTGPEAIRQALLEATRAAQIRKREQERSEQFRAILNYSSVGIIAMDSHGIINLVNTDAGRLLNVRDDAVGCHVDKVLPELGLNSVLISGEKELEEVKMVKELQLAVNKVPVVVDNQIIGAVATFQPTTAIQELERKIRKKMHYRGHVARLNFNDILGDSPVVKNTIATAREFSQVPSNVLIIGETGTGKEMFAQSMHNASSRANGPFVAVNCGALPENLLESELFGYTEGAFTGAVRGGKFGLFELAHHGTIFLDEISEMSVNLQGRLLRVLQEREIMRLGDDHVIPIDIRVFTATNRDLGKMMRQETFREDLYYRIDTLRLTLPPLRERKEDVLLLVNYFLAKYCRRSNKILKNVNAAAQAKLANYYWPGNVRELRNIVERLAVLSKGEVISEHEVTAMLPEENESRRELIQRSGNINQDVVLRVLEETNFHYGKAAAMLGMSRTTLWRRLKQLGISEIKFK